MEKEYYINRRCSGADPRDPLKEAQPIQVSYENGAPNIQCPFLDIQSNFCNAGLSVGSRVPCVNLPVKLNPPVLDI